MTNQSKNNTKKNNINFNNSKMIAFIFILFLSIISLSLNVSAADTLDKAFLNINFLNQDPDPAEPGKYVEIRYNVVKSGNNILNGISFKLEPKYPFLFDESDSAIKTIDSWKGFSDEDEYYTLYYKLKVDDNALEGTYDINLYYSTGTDSWTKYTSQLRVDEKKYPEIELGLIRSEPSKIISDSNDNVLNIEIMNTGDANAQNVIATLNLPEGFENSFGYSNKINLGNIPAHSSKYAKIYFNVNDITSGTYKTSINLKYKEEDESEMIDINIPTEIEILSKPKFKIESISFSKDKISPGDEVSMILKLVNSIDKKVESVSVRAFKESTQPIEFLEKSDYVGTLNSKDMGEAVIKFDIKKNAEPKKYIIDLEIRSIYNQEVFVQSEKITIDVVSSEKKFDKNIITYILSAIIIGLLLIIVLISRKNTK